jgi:hypothetical protein
VTPERIEGSQLDGLLSTFRTHDLKARHTGRTPMLNLPLSDYNSWSAKRRGRPMP